MSGRCDDWRDQSGTSTGTAPAYGQSVSCWKHAESHHTARSRRRRCWTWRLARRSNSVIKHPLVTGLILLAVGYLVVRT